MSRFDVMFLLVFFISLAALSALLGKYLSRALNGDPALPGLASEPMGRAVYRLAGVDPEREMDWRDYAASLLAFNGCGFAVLFAILTLQGSLPLNPQGIGGLSWHLAFNTAASFVTNTNWQSYAGESSLSHFSQMVGLTVQNFLSAATGIAVLLALIRGIVRTSTDRIGNFWVDISRSVLYVLLPLSLVLALALAGQGVVQSLSTYRTAATLEGPPQSIPLGPVASQVAIKQLGTNGGGYFGVNSAHPFENPTPLSNYLEMLSILLLPAALVFMYGRMVGSRRQGYVILLAMFILFSAVLAVMLLAEHGRNPVTGLRAGLEGKELRFGITGTVLWAQATTAASNGSVNAMLDSMSPLAGFGALFNMMLGEVVFGGVGAGLYGMLMFIILTVFIAGLMVGRTPEYLGKKIEKREVQMAVIAVIAPSCVILAFSAAALMLPEGLMGVTNRGPHGLSQVLYAFTSAAANNGSAFAGLVSDTPFYNVLLGTGMLIGRYAVILPALAMAGSLAAKKRVPWSAGSFQTDNALFIFLLIGTITIVGALTFLPSLTLGPLLEHLLMKGGISF